MKKYAKTYSLALGCLIAGTLAMTGCQTIADSKLGIVNPTQAVTLPLADATLQNYRWQLVSVTDLSGKPTKPELFNQAKPLLVSFDKGRVSFDNTCNRMWGNYSLTHDNVLIKNIVSTRMMCLPESRMAFDAAAPSTLQGQFKLTQDTKGQPVLTVTSVNQISIFKSVAK
nr:META domain-containing protein [Moraxella sp. CTOTU46934]